MTNSDPSLNPFGGDGDWRGLMQPALKMNWMEWIVSSVNLQRAWQRVKSNKGAPGIDGMSLEDFPTYARQHWREIRQSLIDGTYKPSPVRRVIIPKPGGKGERMLGVPTVLDRVIQQAILQRLSPIFESGFSDSSYGSRPKRSAHQAIYQVQNDLNQGYRYAVDLDLEKFFDNVQHDVLMSRASRQITDKVLLGLIGRYLRSGVLIGGDIQATELGTPQGSPLSPLLANVLLDDLDKELEKRGS